MHTVVWPDGRAAAPDGEAAAEVLHGRQRLQIAFHSAVDLVGGGKTLGLEGCQQIPQGSDCQNAGGDLLGAVVRVTDEIQVGICQRLQGGGGECHFQAAVIGNRVCGWLQRL